MSQVTSAEVPSGSGLSVRQMINAVLGALMSNNSGSSEPPNPVAGMAWFDTTAGDIKIRNASNTAWLLLSDMIGALEYDRAQSLAEAQKAQIRTNAGLGAVATENIVPISKGGTGAISAAAARAALDVPLAPSSARIEAGQTSAGDALTTPAGGTWQWEADSISLPSGTWAQPRRGGIAGGGSVVVAAQAGIAYMYKFWRIA